MKFKDYLFVFTRDIYRLDLSVFHYQGFEKLYNL